MIPIIDPVNNSPGNGSTTRFDFDFLINNESELSVLHTNSSGVQVSLTLNTDYSINEVKNENGSYITFPLESSSYSVLQSDEKISLILDLPYSQESEFGASGTLNLSVLEQTFDYVTRLIQILKRQIERSIKISEGSDITPNELMESLNQLQVDAANSATAAATSASNAKNSETAAATSVATVNIPSPLGNGLNYLRQKSTEDGFEYLTPDEVKDDIEITWKDISSTPLLARPNISYVSKTGYNNCFMIIDGELYSTTGNTSRGQYLTGRGFNNNPFMGVENFKKVVIPSSYPIVKVGGYSATVAWALLENGELYTWGYNPEGQCGLGHTTRVDVPTLAATGVTDVYDHTSNAQSGGNHSRLFIKKSDGYIYGTGYNSYGQLGLGDTTNRNVFTQITSLGTTVKNVYNLGAIFGCTIVQKQDNSILAAGVNSNGQLGLGNTTGQTSFVDITTAWGGGSTYEIKQAVFGSSYNGASGCYAGLGLLLDNGTDTIFKTCGYNGSGQLGDGTTTDKTTPVTPVIGSGRISKIAHFGTYAGIVQVLKEDGSLYAWGYNAYGAVGDGTTTNRSTPAIVTGSVLDIYSDGIHDYGYIQGQSFIRKADGVYSCGYNGLGECGLGHVTTPVTTHTKMKFPAGIEPKLLGCYFPQANAPVYMLIDTDNIGYVWGCNNYNGITPYSAVNVWVPTKFTITGDN